MRATEFTDNLEIKNTVDTSFRGGYDATLYVIKDDQQVAYLQYSVYKDQPAIKMIWVSPHYRRQKIAYRMLKELQSMFPNEEIDWGYTTVDGTELKRSVPFTKRPNPEIIKKRTKLTAVHSKLRQLNYRLEKLQQDNPEKARAFVATVGDRWNKLNDLAYRLENELYGAKGEYSKFIAEKQGVAEGTSSKNPPESGIYKVHYGRKNSGGYAYYDQPTTYWLMASSTPELAMATAKEYLKVANNRTDAGAYISNYQGNQVAWTNVQGVAEDNLNEFATGDDGWAPEPEIPEIAKVMHRLLAKGAKIDSHILGAIGTVKAVKLEPGAWAHIVRGNSKRGGALTLDDSRHEIKMVAPGKYVLDRIAKGVAEGRSSGYKEIEFVCANPAFPDATDPETQRQLYQELKKIQGVIPLYQDHGEGEMSLTAIYKDANVKQQILRLAKTLGVKVDLIQPVTDDYIDRAIRGEHSGQIMSEEQQSDMFPDEFATKRTKISKQVPVSSRGATATIKLPNINSTGRMISPVKQSLQNFWNWFGDSTAVDSKGRPLVFFHGTNSDFNEFKTHIKTYNNYGLLGNVATHRSAIFVTPEKSFAHNYVRDEMAGANIISVYAKSENPFDLRNGLSDQQWTELENAGYNPKFIHQALDIWEIFDDPEGDHLVSTIKKLGYDSVIINEEGADVWALFSSSQLKAVYGNRGTYDPSNNIVKEQLQESIVEYHGLTMDVKIDGANVDIRALDGGKQIGYVVFDRDGDRLIALDLSVNREFQRQKIATKMYDYVKSLGFIIHRSPNQLSRGKAFWDNSRGEKVKVWEDDQTDVSDEFVSHYSEDPGGVYMHAKSSYLDAVSSAKNHSKLAAELNASHASMSAQQFQDTVMKYFGTQLKHHGWPKHASREWGDAEQALFQELMR
jgi:GNAT superfamily N-acetyltransferase